MPYVQGYSSEQCATTDLAVIYVYYLGCQVDSDFCLVPVSRSREAMLELVHLGATRGCNSSWYSK